MLYFFSSLLEFATNGPGLKTLLTTGSQVIGIDMIDQNTMALVYGKRSWTLSIRSLSEELASKQLIDKDMVFGMVLCRGTRRLGVLISDRETYARIEMYEISGDGKTITKERDVDLLSIGMAQKDISDLYFNRLTYYADVNGFLLARQVDRVELWKIDSVCIPNAQVTARRILNLQPALANYLKTAVHLSDNFFAISFDAKAASTLKVVEVFSETSYNDSIADFRWTTPLACGALFKDDKDALVVLGTQIQPGVGTGMMSAFRWLRNERRLEFGSHLLTDDFLQDGSELGVLSVCGNMVYFAEEGSDDSGKVMEYQFRCE